MNERKTVAFKHKGNIVFSDEALLEENMHDESDTDTRRNKILLKEGNLGKTLQDFAISKKLLPKFIDTDTHDADFNNVNDSNQVKDTQPRKIDGRELFSSIENMSEESVGALAKHIIQKSKVLFKYLKLYSEL